MKEIVVTNQAGLDALVTSLKVATRVVIKTPAETWIEVKTHIEKAHVVAWGSSHVVAWGSSHVVAWGSSHVVAWGSSYVEAWGDSHVEAWENSHVEAWGSSHVVAWENSHVVARGNSHVVARGSSHVEAWGDSHVEAFQNASMKVQEKSVVIEQLRHSAVAICIGNKCKIEKKDKSAQVIVCPLVLYDLKSFCEIYRANMIDKKTIALYKSVKPENHCDHHSGEIKYEVGCTVKPNKWDPNPERECGDGLHLSPTPNLALSYHQGSILKCAVKLADIVIYGANIRKVRCREVTVIEEVTNANT